MSKKRLKDWRDFSHTEVYCNWNIVVRMADDPDFCDNPYTWTLINTHHPRDKRADPASHENLGTAIKAAKYVIDVLVQGPFLPLQQSLTF